MTNIETQDGPFNSVSTPEPFSDYIDRHKETDADRERQAVFRLVIDSLVENKGRCWEEDGKPCDVCITREQSIDVVRLLASAYKDRNVRDITNA